MDRDFFRIYDIDGKRRGRFKCFDVVRFSKLVGKIMIIKGRIKVCRVLG